MRQVHTCMKAFHCWGRKRDARHPGGTGLPKKVLFQLKYKSELGFMALLLTLLKSKGKRGERGQ